MTTGRTPHQAGASDPVRIAVVVPATNVPPTLERCLRAIDAAREGPDEVIVVEGPAGLGPAGARNLGVGRSSADVIVFVDADVEVHPDAFVRVRRVFDCNPQLDGVFGSYDDEPAARSLVSRFRNLLHHHVHQEGAGTAATFWAGLGAVRRDRFLEVGGFDAGRYPVPSIEDIELGMRLVARGASIRLDPKLQGTHLKRWSLPGMIRTDLFARGVPWVTLLLEGRGAPAGLNLGFRHRLSALATLVVLWSVLARRARRAVLALGLLVPLNARFYALLRQKQGTPAAAVGVLLHMVHHLTAVAALVLGVVRHLVRRFRDV